MDFLPYLMVRRAQSTALWRSLKEGPLGIQVRAGLHTGEIERTQTDVHGIAVHIAARVMDTASTGDVLVSRTVKDLVAGSCISFDDAGEQSLKGIEEKWRLYKVRDVA